MDQNKKIELINKIPFFQRFHEQDIELIADISYFKVFKEDEFIIEQGTLNLTLYFLINGMADVFVDKEFVISFKGGGHPFGEMSFVSNDVASASILPKETATMLCIDVDEINKLNDPIHYRLRMDIYRSCASVLAIKLKATNEIAKSFMQQIEKI